MFSRNQKTAPKPTAPSAEAMAALADGLDSIVELVSGHRRKLEAQGFSPTASEQMSTMLYAALCQGIMAKGQK